MSFHHQFVLDQYVLVHQCYHRETVGLWRRRQRQRGDCHTFAVGIFALGGERNGGLGTGSVGAIGHQWNEIVWTNLGIPVVLMEPIGTDTLIYIELLYGGGLLETRPTKNERVFSATGI